MINQNKALYSILKSLKEIEQNQFGHWGRVDWREIKPKTINDKIYLVLKNNNKKAMHFEEIAKRINEISFDDKKANAATVHNELILDDKYVLVGRGLYGLREWGYREGTVSDVIREILAANPDPMTKEEIIDKVLEKRFVKRPDYFRYSAAHSTIVVANTNISELVEKKSYKRIPRNIIFENSENEDSLIWTGSHDGYIKNFNKIIKRKINCIF